MSEYTVTFTEMDGEQVGDLFAMVNEHNRNHGRRKILMPSVTSDDSHATDASELKTADASTRKTPFWMVYCEGGRSPEHKHLDVVSASGEAERVARKSGRKTYVLAVEEEHDPYGMPTWEDVGAHAKAWPANLFHDGCGLWRVVESGKIAAIIGVKQEYNGRISCTANGRNWMSEEDMEILRVNASWFPLYPDGKDISSDDIPF